MPSRDHPPHIHHPCPCLAKPPPSPNSFQTFKLQNKFDGVGGGVISYGPCQFPTLGFVVDRYKRIQNFQARSNVIHIDLLHALPVSNRCEIQPHLLPPPPLPQKPHPKHQRESFWTIRMTYADPAPPQDGAGGGAPPPTAFIWARERLFDEAACFALYSMVVEAGHGAVADVRAE